jgi:hypothetical protein
MIERSGSRSIPGPLTNGSGSGSRRPKKYGSDGSGSATLTKSGIAFIQCSGSGYTKDRSLFILELFKRIKIWSQKSKKGNKITREKEFCF